MSLVVLGATVFRHAGGTDGAGQPEPAAALTGVRDRAVCPHSCSGLPPQTQVPPGFRADSLQRQTQGMTPRANPNTCPETFPLTPRYLDAAPRCLQRPRPLVRGRNLFFSLVNGAGPTRCPHARKRIYTPTPRATRKNELKVDP